MTPAKRPRRAVAALDYRDHAPQFQASDPPKIVWDAKPRRSNATVYLVLGAIIGAAMALYFFKGIL